MSEKFDHYQQTNLDANSGYSPSAPRWLGILTVAPANATSLTGIGLMTLYPPLLGKAIENLTPTRVLLVASSYRSVILMVSPERRVKVLS